MDHKPISQSAKLSTYEYNTNIIYEYNINNIENNIEYNIYLYIIKSNINIINTYHLRNLIISLLGNFSYFHNKYVFISIFELPSNVSSYDLAFQAVCCQPVCKLCLASKQTPERADLWLRPGCTKLWSLEKG